MGRQRTEAPELSQRDQLNDDPRVKEQSQMEDDTKRTLVLNLWPDGDELEELLYDGNPGTIPESAKKDAHQLTALIMKDNCQFFYLVRRVSREELRTTNETAWELLRDFNTRSFPSKVLHKFIDVWVFDENEVEGGFPELVPGPILTVNVSLNKWRGNMKGCAQWVRSKARTNIDSPDGRFSPSHTLSATESPPRVSSVLTNSDQNHTPGLVPEAAEVQTAAAPELRQSPGPHPPLYQQPRNQDSSQTPHQQSPPKQLPPPYNNGTHPETDTGGFLKEILYVLKDIRTSGGRTATAAEQSAQNTSLMRERQGETLALTEEIHDTVTAPSEDTHEAT
ncbi:hypothetical protein GBAR_LOCUS2883 [Geodia barretti]|uniref:Uncharacterized protein n=3 Tax=Geodia barretti TaxID=519541 RepID=A0AA35W3Q4_GEOBA|nr:hypothetical protein GBAR_LOCUS2883 [Geodia barretti]